MPPKSQPIDLPFRIYALGSNGRGQLSLPHYEDTPLPQLCQFHPSSLPLVSSPSASSLPPGVKKVVAGGNHTVLLLTSGLVCLAGRLGSDNDDGVSTTDAGGHLFRVLFRPGPGKEALAPLRCRDVAATWEAVLLVSEDGSEVYAAGRGMKGELGLGEDVTEAVGLRRLDFSGHDEAQVVVVAGGVSHVVALLRDGSLWGWGSCRKGELGEHAAKEGVKVQWRPRRMDGVGLGKGGITSVVCGKESTVVTGNGNVRFLGSNRWIRDGDLSKLVATNPERGRLHASWGSFYFHDESAGTIAAAGRDDRGQMPPAGLPRTVKMAAGSEHVAALTVHGEAISWGWGEHGNCGPVPLGLGVAADVVAGRWNVIPVELEAGWRVTSVGAGCATTFLIADKSK